MQRPPKSVFEPPRRSPRFVPTRSLTVAMMKRGQPFAYGVIANISAGGMCLQSSELAATRELEVALTFPDGYLLEATGRIVWSKDFDRTSGYAVYGLEFTELSPKGKAQLDAALESSSFVAEE